MGCVDNAKGVIIEDKIEHQQIKDVYFRVFFDGTNNNMVQQAYFHTLKKSSIDDMQRPAKQDYERKEAVIKEISEKRALEQMLSLAIIENATKPNLENSLLIRKLTDNIQKLCDKIEKMQVETRICTSTMYSDRGKGYSNIAILHSLLQNQPNTFNSVYYNLYIEGAGATDLNSYANQNINGLGFGLGETGVTALVSKAIKYIHLFLREKNSLLSEKTNYHFYVFGFSRGATCARLFAELTTRDEGKTLLREEEFDQETSKVKFLYDREKKRLPFMESDFLKTDEYGMGDKLGVRINRANVKVEFLGLYDTVASIGFLKQKDGWVNSLSWLYRIFPNNYQGNFHYMNARDYGLYSPHNARVLHTCHICAGDEFRENFALVNLGRMVPSKAIEIIIPGCHSDVGGGYVTDTSMDVVLYKFIPRKIERFIKSNKILEILSFPYLKLKERAKMFISDPLDVKEECEELGPNTLAKLGWIGKEWSDGQDKGMELASDGKPYTIRVADWPNEIKFKRFSFGGYSNIPLQMMKKCVEECGYGDLFVKSTAPYEIPDDLKMLGKKMLAKVKIPDGSRVWLMPDGNYSGENYRKLRLKYLHFTASCEIAHMRSRVDEENLHSIDDKDEWYKIGEINWANFGNNCNYDEKARICRIVYNGDEELAEGDNKGSNKDYEPNVHYMYELSDMGCQIVPIPLD